MTLKDYKKSINDKFYKKDITPKYIEEVLQKIDMSLIAVTEQSKSNIRLHIFNVLFKDYYFTLYFDWIENHYYVAHHTIKEIEGSFFYKQCLIFIRDQKLNQILNDNTTN